MQMWANAAKIGVVLGAVLAPAAPNAWRSVRTLKSESERRALSRDGSKSDESRAALNAAVDAAFAGVDFALLEQQWQECVHDV